MDVLEEAKRSLNQLRDSVRDIVKKTFEEEKKHIIKLNTDVLYNKGERADGRVIKPLYSPVTVSIKKRKNQPTDRVTLKDTGRLHRTLIVTPKENHVEITSDVPYAKYLFKKYGGEVLGIQEELLRDFVELYIVPNLKEEVKEKILKGK